MAILVIALTKIKYFSGKTDKFNMLLDVLVLFACGALIGDSFIHIIPEVYTPAEDGKLKDDPMVLSLMLFTGFLVFFII